MSTSLEHEFDFNDLGVWLLLHAGKMDLDLGAEVQSMWKLISGGGRECNAVSSGSVDVGKG